MAEKILALDFDEICDLFVSLGAHTPPSEVHGLLAGQLSAGKRMTDQQWLDEAQTSLDTDNAFSPANEEALVCIYANTLASLGDDSYSFYPLLPHDSESLDERLSSLSLWCQGFMAGFALVEKSIAELSDIVNDALHDLAAISQVGIENDEEDFDASADDDYMQLVEYVRLAAMNIFAEYAVAIPEVPAEKAAEGMSVQSLFRNRQIH